MEDMGEILHGRGQRARAMDYKLPLARERIRFLMSGAMDCGPANPARAGMQQR